LSFPAKAGNPARRGFSVLALTLGDTGSSAFAGDDNPPLQSAVDKVITEAMRIFCRDIETPAERRRAVMKIYITLYGGMSLYAAGVLDQPSEKALIAELSAMNARK
jgi:hypothetical protein